MILCSCCSLFWCNFVFTLAPEIPRSDGSKRHRLYSVRSNLIYLLFYFSSSSFFLDFFFFAPYKADSQFCMTYNFINTWNAKEKRRGREELVEMKLLCDDALNSGVLTKCVFYICLPTCLVMILEVFFNLLISHNRGRGNLQKRRRRRIKGKRTR